MRIATSFVLLTTATLFVASPAFAADEGPCGNFDFSGDRTSCKVDVQAPCTARCETGRMVVACDRMCGEPVTAACTDACKADAEVNCESQCAKPTGSIYCGGQFVNASDVDACIKHVATKFDIVVDTSARTSGDCPSGNCGAPQPRGVNLGGSNPTKGCAAAKGASAGVTGALSVLGFALVALVARRRRRA